MAVGKFHLPIISGESTGSGEPTNATPTPYVRPSDWLPIDNLVNPGDEKFVGLVAVFQEGNFIAIEVGGTGNIRVDWGDGVVENYTGASNNIYHNYDYNYSGFVGTETSRGYRQAIITITPTSGVLNRLNFSIKHNQTDLNFSYSTGLLDVKMSGININTLNFTTYSKMLEQFDYVGTNNIVGGAANLFNGCISLKNIKNLDTSKFTSASGLFQNCRNLEKIPTLNLLLCTNLQDTFNGCHNLKNLDGLSLSSAINLTRCFQNCYSIVKFPNFTLNSATTFANMFQNCVSMVKNPILTLNSTLTKSFASMFMGCVSLIEYIPLNTDRASSYSSMFSGCSLLKKIDTFSTNTDSNFTCDSMFLNCTSLKNVPNMNLTTCTLVSNMFNGCSSLEYVPNFNLINCTTFNFMFNNCIMLENAPEFTLNTTSLSLNFSFCFSGCSNLKKAPNWNLIRATNVSSMFQNCSNMQTIPTYNLSNVTTSGGTIFNGCGSLFKGTTVGMRYTHSYQNCKLSRTELVSIFTGLGTAVGAQTITITGNYGASLLTAPERAIATGKGWTIVG